MFSFNWKAWWNPAPAEQAIAGSANDVMRQAAIFCRDLFVETAPEDTGYLKSTADVVPGLAPATWYVEVGAYYSAWVELGHMANGTWVPPRSTLRNALAATAQAFPQFSTQFSTSPASDRPRMTRGSFSP